MKIVSEGVNNFLAIDNPKSSDTESFRVAIIGGSGSGKTLTAMRIVGDLVERGYKVVSINDKGTIEHGACMLPSNYITGKLKTRLNQHGIIPKQIKCKIIHHLTTNLPDRKTTKIHFKSIPIKELLEKTDSLLYYLCGGLSQESTMKILKNAIKQMKPSETWYDLCYTYLNSMIERKQEQVSSTQTLNLIDEENFFLKGAKSSQIQNLDTLLRNFMFLKESPIFQPLDCEHNFNFKKDIVDSEENFIALTDCFEEEDNTAGILFQMFFLTQIIKHKRNYDFKLCILIDEGSKFVPSGLNKDSIGNIMANLLVSLLNNYARSYRTSAIICNQSRDSLDPRIFKKNCLSHHLYGKNDSPPDINAISKLFHFDEESRRSFERMKDFNYYGFKIDGYDAVGTLKPIYIFPPEFPTTDEGINTEEELSKLFPYENYSTTLLPSILKLIIEQKARVREKALKDAETNKSIKKEEKVKEEKAITKEYELIIKLDKKIPDSRTKASEIAKIVNFSPTHVRNILRKIKEDENVSV